MPDIQAAVLTQFHTPLSIERLRLDAPGPGEVLVRMVAAGVCHSDLHVIKEELPQRLPMVLGHEGAGVIEAVGDNVDDLKAGTPVVLVWVPECGHCEYCAGGEAHLCDNADPRAKDNRLWLGDEPVMHFLSTAAFADYVLVPASGVVPVGPDIALESAALVSCSVVTGIGAVQNAAHVPAGATAAIFGSGGVGLNVVQGLRLAGAERIIAIDRVPARLETARKFGATDTLDVSDPDLNAVKALRDLTNGRGVDFAFEAVGHAEVFKQAYAAIRKGGLVVLVGIAPLDQKFEIRGASLVLQEKRVAGSFYGSMSPREHIPRLLAQYAAGDLLLDELLSHRFALSEINEAFAALERGEVTRGVIHFDS